MPSLDEAAGKRTDGREVEMTAGLIVLQRRTRFCATTAVAALLSICGCAHLDSMDPLGSMAQVPRSPAAVYAPLARPGDQVDIRDEDSPDVTGRILTLADCVRIGLELNPSTKFTWQAVQSAAARVGEEQSAYFPEVDLSAGAVREKQVTFQSLQSNQQPSTDDLFTTAFALKYLLFDGGQRAARVSSVQADLQSVGFQHNTGLQSVALKVEQAYYTLLATQWALQVAEETVRSNESHVRLAQARFDAGLVPRSDVLKAATAKADADLALVGARDSVRIAEGTLVSAMGLKVSTPVRIADVSENAHGHETQDMNRLLDEAARNRPELLAAASKVKAKQAAIQEAKSQYWPKLNANAGYGWIDNTFFPNHDQWAVGVTLDFPLFTGFKREYQVKRAKSDTEQARADYVSQLRGVELEVWTAYSRLIEADEAIQAAQIFVASADESARLADGEYKAGAGTIIALIDAQTALTSARNRLVQARFTWYTVRAQFERAIGRSLTSRAETAGPAPAAKDVSGLHSEIQNQEE
jgi:outer membrane protein